MPTNHYKNNRRNYYRLLHVQPDAPGEVIKASYRTLMQKLRQHPDLGGDDCNAALLNEAYAVLTNPERRAPGTFRNRYQSGIHFVTLQIPQAQGRFVSETV